MTRLGLKLFYLRTHEKQLRQQDVADALRIRQSTLSHLERGLSRPTVQLLTELCRYFDVSPTYLIDETRGLVPRPWERWQTRDDLASAGMWVEAPTSAVRTLPDGKLLCRILPGERVYDDETAALRSDAAIDTEEFLRQLRAADEASIERDHALATQLEDELQRPSRARGRS